MLRALRQSQADGRTSNRVVVRLAAAEYRMPSGVAIAWEVLSSRQPDPRNLAVNTGRILEESLVLLKPTQIP